MRTVLIFAFMLFGTPQAFSQSINWMINNFEEYIFTSDYEDYINRSENIIDEIEDRKENKRAENILDLFKLINGPTGEQPYICNFNLAMNEISASYQDIKVNENISVLKIKFGKYNSYILMNSHKQNGFLPSFSYSSTDQTEKGRIKRGVGAYSCARLKDFTIKDLRFSLTKVEPIIFPYEHTFNCL
jgi:hypothetical protein